MNQTISEGSVIEDNDKRNKGRSARITKVENGIAYYKANTRTAKIRIDRIHTDNKPHSNGWSLVSPAPTGGI